jgi:beta-lactam-binding protein with PASTA domain
MSFVQYIKSKRAWKHLAYVAGLYVLLMLLSWFYLSWYTGHGEYVTIPDVRGKLLTEATEIMEDLDLEVVVIDSVWSDTAVKGSVKEMSPGVESTLKEGREIYLTIYRLTPPMEIINIKQGEYADVAKVKLENKGISFDVEYQANNNFVGNVIAIRCQGREIGYNQPLARGSRVKLIVGKSDGRILQVPDLFGMTYIEAIRLLKSMDLQHQLFFDIAPASTDSLEFKICKQEPPFSPASVPVSTGSIVDVYLSKTPCERDTVGLSLPKP